MWRTSWNSCYTPTEQAILACTAHYTIKAVIFLKFWVHNVYHSPTHLLSKYFFFEGNCTIRGKKTVHNFQICTYNPSMYRSQTIVVWMVKPLSTVSKDCAYMLNTDFIPDMQLCTLNLCGLYFLPSHFRHLECNYCCFCNAGYVVLLYTIPPVKHNQGQKMKWCTPNLKYSTHFQCMHIPAACRPQ